jgi:hydroxyethylthiazole kinase-like uncharacterized protein yjeF
MSTPIEPVTASALRGWPLPQPSGTKNSRGRVVVIGGGPTTPGAAMLAGLAGLRVGAGVLALVVAAPVAAVVAAALPEASVAPLEPSSIDEQVSGADAVLVGPGFDDAEVAADVVPRVLAAVDRRVPVVLDAYALGVLPGLDVELSPRVVLTPNTSEAARLLDVPDVEAGPDLAQDIALRYRAVVTCHNQIAAPDGRQWAVPTGHPGLGTSGSGDVLAGAVVGLLARGADPAQAACWGTYLHATAGDRLAARVGRLGFLARELVDELPLVIVEAEA